MYLCVCTIFLSKNGTVKMNLKNFLKSSILIGFEKNNHLCKVNIPKILRNIGTDSSVFQIHVIWDQSSWTTRLLFFFLGLFLIRVIIRASLIAPLVKNLPALQETPVQFLGREDPLEKDTPGFLPGESRGQRSLAGYSPWGRKSQT